MRWGKCITSEFRVDENILEKCEHKEEATCKRSLK
jgi:hypothetical protein